MIGVGLHAISLCSGVGMLDEGCAAAFEHLGVGYRVVAHVEREAFAAGQLVTLMEAGLIHPAPVWTDLCTFDAAAWRGKVDCVTAGFPCQPHSVAGSRKGVQDERWIWPDIVRIIRESGAWCVVLENVRGLLSSGGMDGVLADLAGLGFDAEWTVLGAGEVGASHKRERVFIVGLADGAGGRFGELRESSGRDGFADRGDAIMDDAGRQRGPGQGLHPRSGRSGPPAAFVGWAGEAVADAGHQPGWPKQQVAVAGCGCHADDCVCGQGMAHASSEPDRPEAGRHEVGWQDAERSAGRAGGSGGVLADDQCAGRRSEAIPIQSGQPALAEQGGPRRGECGGDAFGRPEFVGDELADTRGARPQRHEQRNACDGNRGGEETHGPVAQLRDDELFAPGPSDGRWPDIIARKPWLAPATESGVRLLVDGVAYVVDESRRHQLRAIGNGVVALQCSAAVVALVRRLT